MQRGRIGDAHSTVAVAGVDRGLRGIDGAAGVDLVQPRRAHGNGHHAFPVGTGRICDCKQFAVRVPCGDLVGAGRLLEELDHDVIALVADTAAQRVHEAVLCKIRGYGGDAGERA